MLGRQRSVLPLLVIPVAPSGAQKAPGVTVSRPPTVALGAAAEVRARADVVLVVLLAVVVSVVSGSGMIGLCATGSG